MNSEIIFANLMRKKEDESVQKLYWKFTQGCVFTDDFLRKILWKQQPNIAKFLLAIDEKFIKKDT